MQSTNALAYNGTDCLQETGWALRDKLIELGLLRPGVYVFKQYPTVQEREAEAVRSRLYENGAPKESHYSQCITHELNALGYA